MSFYGFNSAAINGGVAFAIAGEALIKASSSFEAAGTRIRTSEATFVGMSGGSAKGIRVVMAEADFIGGADLYAPWNLLFDVTATLAGSSGFKATPTGAHVAATSEFSAEPTQILPGAGIASGHGLLMVTPLREAAGAAVMQGMASLQADPGVKLSGQSTVQREGYATFSAVSALYAGGVRLAQGGGDFVVRSTFSADSTYVQGGMATFAARSEFLGIGTTEFANFIAEARLIARGTVTQFGAMQAVSSSEFTAIDTVLTQGTVLPYEGHSDFAALGRYALRSSGAFNARGALSAAGRLALQSSAAISSRSDLMIDPVVIIPASATEFVGAGSLYAPWIILRDGAATFIATSKLTATGRTNVEAEDPPERTMKRPFTDREMRRPFIDREMRRKP